MSALGDDDDAYGDSFLPGMAAMSYDAFPTAAAAAPTAATAAPTADEYEAGASAGEHWNPLDFVQSVIGSTPDIPSGTDVSFVVHKKFIDVDGEAVHGYVVNADRTTVATFTLDKVSSKGMTGMHALTTFTPLPKLSAGTRAAMKNTEQVKAMIGKIEDEAIAKYSMPGQRPDFIGIRIPNTNLNYPYASTIKAAAVARGYLKSADPDDNYKGSTWYYRYYTDF
jgi:hypothetical protein